MISRCQVPSAGKAACKDVTPSSGLFSRPGTVQLLALSRVRMTKGEYFELTHIKSARREQLKTLGEHFQSCCRKRQGGRAKLSRAGVDIWRGINSVSSTVNTVLKMSTLTVFFGHTLRSMGVVLGTDIGK